ncbi:serine/threonine dehydratase [Thalassiella azotivora]
MDELARTTDERRVTRPDVVVARRLLGERVRRTPLVDVEAGALGPASVTCKLELLQHTGSFKARGALTALTTATLPTAGVVAASGGNHGLAVAWAAQQVGATATVFVPASAPEAKVRGLRALGADVRVGGSRYADALDAARAHERASGALAVHAYDEPAVVAGQGTLALELLDDLADRRWPGAVTEVDTVLGAVGGGGLAAGVAAALDGRARVVGVEPVGCPTWHRALAEGHPVDVEVGGLAADALGATRLGDTAWHTLTHAAATSVLVDADAVGQARRLLWQRLRVAAEPGGAVAVAALVSGAYRPRRGERVAVVVCGGNADPADLTA